MASFSILAVLASATHFTRRVCSVSACHRDLAAVRLLYARPLRSLLQPSRRSEVLELARDRPLTSLHAALSSRLPAGVAVPADVFLARGRRRIESDAELAEVLAAAVAHGVDPHLRVQTSDELGSAVAAAAQAAEQAAALASAEAATADAAELSAGPKQLLSFFLFSKIAAGRLPLLQLQLHQALSRLGARGSVYVAGEGLNAQLALPATRLLELRLALGRIPELAQIDLNLGVQVPAQERPYHRLLVRQKPQVLTDGLPAPLDWRNAGRDLPAAAWHAELASLPTDAVVLDCRNDFESALGSFAQAEPLGTQAFSQSWDALRSRLASTPRDAPIYTFCTGGIRCVKVNAWLEAEMGFNNTARLRDGIHGYMRFVEAEAERQARSPAELSHWRGANFVFYKGSPRVLGDNNLEAAEGQRGPGAAEAAGAGVHDLTLEDDSRW